MCVCLLFTYSFRVQSSESERKNNNELEIFDVYKKDKTDLFKYELNCFVVVVGKLKNIKQRYV